MKSRGLFFLGNVQPAPGVQGIVDFKLVFQVFQIIGEAQAVAAGNRFQPTRDGFLIDILVNIRGVDDLCQAQQAGFLQAILEDE